MVSLLKNTLTITSYFILLSSFSHLSHGVFSEELFETISMKRMEKTTHLRFFFHDVHSGKTPSAIKIAGTPDSGLFGDTYMMDNMLTEGQEAASRVVGKAQGLYAFAARKEPALLMVVNFEFTQGDYNGSSISVLGRNPVMVDVREMPIVGGSGQFRYANGYVLVHTVWFDPKTTDAIVEYNVYVKHY
ncbi:dirigent protein 22-like [Cynara cardunculus var. scolymus]|uniref:Dirigent protein n=1 Tax=Cynara cardunculus var. scolymus TaxID=59895 RepID=A0A103Y1L5_CYNCS|nr:dirigent protein 22-like [Cynara cardunculus var. scolymus]KVI00845.1 Plant disease resistance response protein [Cynara cardunculus var. scolymus]